MKANKPVIGLQTKITLLVCGVVAMALLVTNVLISSNVFASTQKALNEKATDIAQIIARSEVVIEALSGRRDEMEIQAFAEEIRSVTKVEFIVVIDMNSIRKSHPDSSKVGQQFVGGDEKAALSGQKYTSMASGTLGPSLRAFAPIVTRDGKQVGAVAVGILLNDVQHAVDKSRMFIYLAVVFGLMVGAVGALLLARSIKKTLFGLEPIAIAKLLEERSAMLLSVREGIIAVDKNARITLVNGEAIRLLQQAGIQGDPVGKDVESFVPNTRLSDVLKTGCAELDQEQDLKGITLLTNRVPVCVDGEIAGAIATFRDKTEIRQLAEQLTGVRNYAEALRAQAHEFMNKLHVILGMVRLQCYDQLADYIKNVAQHYQSEVGFVVRRIKDQVLAGFLLGKLSHAREAGVDLILSEESFLPEPADTEVAQELVTVVGNLVNNALEAVASSNVKRVGVDCIYNEGILHIAVADTGPGVTKEQQQLLFAKGYSTKNGNRGLGMFLVKRSLERIGGTIEVFSEIGEGTRFVVRVPYRIKGDAE
ncbi:DcuS/MalK family sensor histidine kinase [Sporomusa malonica]|uniref:histidine kinase n=1 Tax=Sporomusa malonica TaxID=112901 RepID=A0A1W2DEE9_9FIRM|nr:DcuS/MalK family sensor histidine kinase [Sporomusa malonica]SMC95870.1 two-component system, CitB family, sensor histidine kinase MalK [Sporomusa malonica]